MTKFRDGSEIAIGSGRVLDVSHGASLLDSAAAGSYEESIRAHTEVPVLFKDLIAKGLGPFLISDAEGNPLLMPVDVRSLGVVFSPDGMSGIPEGHTGLVSFPTFIGDGRFSPLESERLKLVTHRYLEERFVNSRMLISMDGVGPAHVDVFTKNGMQMPFVLMKEGVPVSSFRFIFPNCQDVPISLLDYDDAEDQRVLPLRFGELPLSRLLPKELRSMAHKDGIYQVFNGRQRFEKVFLTGEASQLASNGGGRGDALAAVFQLFAPLVERVHDPAYRQLIEESDRSLGIALSAQPQMARILQRRLVGSVLRYLNNGHNLEVIRVGPEEALGLGDPDVDGAYETPLLIRFGY